MLALLAVLGGLVLGGIYGWRRFATHRAAKRAASSSLVPVQHRAEPAAAAADPVVDNSASSLNSAASVALDLAVSTSAATRVRIVADGALLLDAELPAGETRHFSAKQQFEVTAADSSAVLLELNGQTMPPVGTPGASGTIVLGQKDLRQAPGGTSQP